MKYNCENQVHSKGKNCCVIFLIVYVCVCMCACTHMSEYWVAQLNAFFKLWITVTIVWKSLTYMGKNGERERRQDSFKLRWNPCYPKALVDLGYCMLASFADWTKGSCLLFKNAFLSPQNHLPVGWKGEVSLSQLALYLRLSFQLLSLGASRFL